MNFPLLTVAALTLVSQAQVFTPQPQSSPQPARSTNTQSSQSSNSNNQFGGTQYAFGDEIPLLNPGNETITIGGLTIPLGDNRVIKSRFEKYLSQPAEDIEAAREYHAILDQIIDILAPRPGQTRSRQSRIEEAFTLLPEAASYPGDAKICQSLAETVYASLQAKKDIGQMSSLNNALEKKRENLAIKADWMRRTATSPSLGESGKVGGASSAAVQQAKRAKAQAEVMSSQKYTAIIKEIAEIEGMRKKHTIQSEKQILQTKIQFQASIAQWLMQRRFHHVIIAARFYNVLWQDGDNALHIRKDATLSKLFANSVGFSPTVTAIDSIANEAVRDTENAIDACLYLMEQGDLHSASQRLLEAFAIGEFLTPLTLLDRNDKREIQVYTRELSQLFDAIQAKDFGRARELTVGLKGKAQDFPSSKAESAISANVIASNMAIKKAQKALLRDDEAGVAEGIKTATEYWPTNPKLMEFSDLMDQGTQLVSTQNDFKRLIREQNYREIFKRQYEIAPTIANSPEDLAAFNEIIENLRTIEIALQKADSFSKAGNSYAAWEQLDALREDFPDDPKLGRQLELLAPKVADFTRALLMARELEDRTPQQTGSAISHYLKAKTIYPNSEYANDGLARLINATIGEY